MKIDENKDHCIYDTDSKQHNVKLDEKPLHKNVVSVNVRKEMNFTSSFFCCQLRNYCLLSESSMFTWDN